MYVSKVNITILINVFWENIVYDKIITHTSTLHEWRIFYIRVGFVA